MKKILFIIMILVLSASSYADDTKKDYRTKTYALQKTDALVKDKSDCNKFPNWINSLPVDIHKNVKYFIGIGESTEKARKDLLADFELWNGESKNTSLSYSPPDYEHSDLNIQGKHVATIDGKTMFFTLANVELKK